jgi:DNA-binding NarL/FixJ family response regulator
MPQSVYLVDDHPIVRIGLRTLLERSGYIVTGEAESAEQAFDDSMLLKVDVIILDIRLPGIDGIDLLQRIFTMKSDARVVVYSGHENPTYAARAIALGAKAIVYKDQRLAVLTAAIEKAMVGESSIDHLERKRIANVGTRAKNAFVFDDVSLTQRELDVLKHLANGLTNKEIALSLGIGYETVKEHVQHVLRKLSVSDRTQAAVWAVRQKVV